MSKVALSWWLPSATRRTSLGWLATGMAVLAIVGSALSLRSQTVDARMTQSFYQSLDRQAGQAKDSASIRALFLQIHARTLAAPMPQSVLDRLTRAQEGFLGGTQRAVTEEAVAEAVNAMGRSLDPVTYTGTNALQVHLLRISFLPKLPLLMASASPRPANQIVSNDMSPAGAAYLGLILLRQKMTNPAWFGDPDSQNKVWSTWKPKTAAAGKPAIVVRDERPEATNFRLMMTKGLANEGSTTTKAYHEFLNRLGVQQ